MRRDSGQKIMNQFASKTNQSLANTSARSRQRNLTLVLPPSLPKQTLQTAIQRKSSCACGGGCPRCERESNNFKIQNKLAISTPGDKFEQEADAVADQVMRMPDSVVQRQCKSCSDASALNPNYDEEPQVKRQANGESGSREVASDFTSGFGAGVPLDTASRSFFEPRFGHDFSSVRVHANDAAAESAAAIDAQAYTIGHDVVFGAGRWSPDSTAGRRLLAHELAHVAQQSDGAPGMIRREPIEGDDLTPTEDPEPLQKPGLPPPNKAPSCDEVCGNSAETCVRAPGEECSEDMTKKLMTAWQAAATQIAGAIDALGESPLSATTLAALKDNFNWSPGKSPTDLPTKVATNVSTAATKMSDNLCIKCLRECPPGAAAQIARARGKNCLGSNCFKICPNFAETDTHVLLHELFHRVASGAVEDLYRGQVGYPPPPSTALKMADCYASLIDDTAAASSAAAAAAKAKAGTKTP
jgi:hypothetical protein